jgi:hypothetical protein
MIATAATKDRHVMPKALRMMSAAAGVGVLFTLLAACSSGSSDATSNTPQGAVGDSGGGATAMSTATQYSFQSHGTVGTIEVVKPIDPRVAKIEAYRKLAHGHSVTYVVATVDNTNGTEGSNMYAVDIVTGEGQQITAMGVSEAFSPWMDHFEHGGNFAPGYNTGVDLSNRYQFGLDPGAKGTAILVTRRPVASIMRMFVYPDGGMEQVEATPIT